MKRKECITGLVLLMIGTGCVMSNFAVLDGGQKRKLLRVGVYDSRGIAIAYANSESWAKVLKEKQAALEQAKKDGDTEKVKELEAWGPEQQAKMHLQGFGTAPVHAYLEQVKDKLPRVAEKTGVDVIVSKWEMDYVVTDAEMVDVTMELAALFEPKERAYEWIEEIKNKEPYSRKKLEQLEKEHTR
jgi:hypothetical protein